MRDIGRALLLGNVVSTMLMTGVIWFVQIVHYPLFASVGKEQFVAYEAEHQQRTTWVVAPLMLAELATAIALIIERPMSVHRGEAWLGIALVALIWASTFFLQVPLHERLGREFREEWAARLVATNWVRTIAWSLRTVLCVTWISRLFS